MEQVAEVPKPEAATEKKPKRKPAAKAKKAAGAKKLKAKTPKAAKKAKPTKAKAKVKAAKKAPKAKAPRVLKAKAPKKMPRKTAKLARKLAAPTPVIKHVIQGADQQALQVLVEGVKKNHLDAEKYFHRIADRAPEAVRRKAVALVENLGLSPRSAATLALRCAELAEQAAESSEDEVAETDDDPLVEEAA